MLAKVTPGSGDRLSFCTLFDERYLPRGLALIESLAHHATGCTIWVLCMDSVTHGVLSRLALPGVRAIPLSQVEDDGLLRVKAGRTPEEYCWTNTPVIAQLALQRDVEATHIAYVDADVCFLDNPRRLLNELSGGSILIFEHGFPASLAHLIEPMGRFNVDVLVFRRDRASRDCLAWWRERCLEWCFHRAEPGRMGDQKYLDEWPRLFPAVVIASAAVPGLAPWNLEGHHFELAPDLGLLADGAPVLFVHYSKLQMYWRGEYVACRGYSIPDLLLRTAYAQYFEALDRAWDRIVAVAPGFTAGLRRPSFRDRARRLTLRLLNRLPRPRGLGRTSLGRNIVRLLTGA